MCLVTDKEVELAGSEVWVKRDGSKVAVKDMSDAHVRAAFEQLLKKIRLAGREEDVVVKVKRSADSEGGLE